MNEHAPTIVWFQRDLRLKDHPALTFALEKGCPIIPIFIYSNEENEHQEGGASKWWLHQSLHQLDQELKKLGSKLIIRNGKILPTLIDLVKETNAKSVVWCKRFEPHHAEQENEVEKILKGKGIEARSFNGSLLTLPGEIASHDTFAPFFAAFLEKVDVEKPLPAPQHLPHVSSHIKSDSLDSLHLEPLINWTSGLKSMWQPGEEGAHHRLHHFIHKKLEHYEKDKDKPAKDATSQLSPHIHFGEISPREIWNEVKEWAEDGDAYLKELCSREFAYHLLYHYPNSVEKPMQSTFEAFPWREHFKRDLSAWQSGRTGYPIIDAGMRELWITGWMHNRVRMIVASFLTKDLLIPWQEGAKWFWDTLVDADLANNVFGWQRISGCATDAAPYFRVFNPVTQSEKFDPDGTYIRRWVPELAKLSNNFIHRPWTASELELQLAGIRLGLDYPKPIVDHEKARQNALKAFAEIK